MSLLQAILRYFANDRLSVFLFHKVPSNSDPLLPNDLDIVKFSRVLDFIEENFHVLPLDEAVNRLENGSLQPLSAAVTFDDGYSDWSNGIATMLKNRSIPATLFITTGQLFGRPMWHERLANVIKAHSGVVLDTTRFRLPALKTLTTNEKVIALRALEYHFKYLPIVIRDQYLQQLEETVGVTSASVDTLTIDDLIKLSNLGFEIGAHTQDHPILGLCDEVRAQNEIGECREILEGLIKVPVRSFAYPNGLPGVDFSSSHIQMVKNAGYRCAVTTQWGAATRLTSAFQIPRFTPWGPSRGRMSIQVARNLLTSPKTLDEKR